MFLSLLGAWIPSDNVLAGRVSKAGEGCNNVVSCLSVTMFFVNGPTLVNPRFVCHAYVCLLVRSMRTPPDCVVFVLSPFRNVK